ncbi:MAG: hypothetical protein HWE27_11225 [Gammaproteobacteria bacterium]|nr:hypothetical protein [Gammaproteobacteria bacterium]
MSIGNSKLNFSRILFIGWLSLILSSLTFANQSDSSEASQNQIKEESPAIQMPGTDISLFEVSYSDNKPDVTGASESEAEGKVFSNFNKPLVTSIGYDNQPKFYDNDKLFYTAQLGNQTDIFLLDIHTLKSKQLTQTPVSEYSPSTYLSIDSQFKFSAVVADEANQTLVLYSENGKQEEQLDKGIVPVGYYLFVGDDYLAMFRVAEPSELILVDLKKDKHSIVDKNIGRSFMLKNESEFYYARKQGDDYLIVLYNVRSGESNVITRLPKGVEDFSYHTKLGLLSSNGANLVRYDPKTKDWALFSSQNEIKNISRLNVSPNGQWIAVVHDDR